MLPRQSHPRRPVAPFCYWAVRSSNSAEDPELTVPQGVACGAEAHTLAELRASAGSSIRRARSRTWQRRHPVITPDHSPGPEESALTPSVGSRIPHIITNRPLNQLILVFVSDFPQASMRQLAETTSSRSEPLPLRSIPFSIRQQNSEQAIYYAWSETCII